MRTVVSIHTTVSDIYALRAAVDRLLQDDLRIERHKNIADRVRAALETEGWSCILKMVFPIRLQLSMYLMVQLLPIYTI